MEIRWKLRQPKLKAGEFEIERRKGGKGTQTADQIRQWRGNVDTANVESQLKWAADLSVGAEFNRRGGCKMEGLSNEMKLSDIFMWTHEQGD